MPNSQNASSKGMLLAAFFSLYVIWGSTFFAIRIGVHSWPPFMMAGLRFLLAGLIMGSVLLVLKHPLPTKKEWGGALILGILMPGVGNGLVTLAEKEVSSGVAALAIATVPVFTLIFASLFGRRPRKLDWAGVLLGLVGLVVLNMGSNLQASPSGAVLLIIASAGWALGSAWSPKLPQPNGPMGSAAMMVCAGSCLLLASLVKGESLHEIPPVTAWMALVYLIFFGSIIGYSAYLYLLRHVSPAAATSYAYVNPIIAVILGAVFLDEQVGMHEMMAMLIIVSSVVIISWRRN